MCSQTKSEEISFVIDDFISDKDSTIWYCELSNGKTVYQDDDRPGYDEPSAWLRLAKYLHENKVNIVKMWIRFRSHIELVGENAEGYFFRKSVLGGLAMQRDEVPINKHYYLAGCLRDGKIEVVKWQVPELIEIERETRYPTDGEKYVGISLIKNAI